MAEFLVIYRNIFESGETANGEDEERANWTIDSVSEVPLESDAVALEYLARRDFNLEEALVALYCELGFSKGTTGCAISDRTVPYRTVSCRVVSCRVVSCHVILMACHRTSRMLLFSHPPSPPTFPTHTTHATHPLLSLSPSRAPPHISSRPSPLSSPSSLHQPMHRRPSTSLPDTLSACLPACLSDCLSACPCLHLTT